VDCNLVLVIDDDEGIREVLRDILEAEGYRVATAANGREALTRLRGEGDCPCIILLDLMMPVMDGWAFRGEQTQEPSLAGIPVVVLSAESSPSTQTRTLAATGHLTKPVRLEELLHTVRSLCAGRRSALEALAATPRNG
jgi:CheY-like chemotaxis protein